MDWNHFKTDNKIKVNPTFKGTKNHFFFFFFFFEKFKSIILSRTVYKRKIFKNSKSNQVI